MIPRDDSPVKSSSYKPCEGCGADCMMLSASTVMQPCWGDVYAMEDYGDGCFSHICQGHIDQMYGYLETGANGSQRWVGNYIRESEGQL